MATTIGRKTEEIGRKTRGKKPEEILTITPKEAPLHLKHGKDLFNAGQLAEALKEFEAILSVAPGNIENRVWLRKTNQKLAEPRVEGVTEGEAAPAAEAKPTYCVWMAMGMVSYRLCTHNYDCLTCEFDQTMHEKLSGCEAPELEYISERSRLPGNQRLCRYAIMGNVSHRLCTRGYQCVTCEFGQVMEDAIQQKLAKLAARREALRKRMEKVEAIA